MPCTGFFTLKMVSICEQWGLQAPLEAAELYREGSCCWRCLSPTSLMIRGHCPVFPDQQVMGHRWEAAAAMMRMTSHRATPKEESWRRVPTTSDQSRDAPIRLLRINFCYVWPYWPLSFSDVHESLKICFMIKKYRAGLPVRPGGLCRRRLDDTLSVSYQIQSPLGGGSEKNTYKIEGQRAH